MTRRRWVYIGTEAIEIEKYTPPVQGITIMGDSHYDGLTSPVDGADISSRAKHREYMKRKGLCTIDDYKGQFAQDAAARAEFYTKAPDPSRASDIARAYEHHTRRK
jgi:hypothetical protein